MSSFSRYLTIACLGLPLLTGCSQKNEEAKQEYPMGERAPVGSLTYKVLDSKWESQLGEMFKLRFPQQRFLVISLSITNGGGRELSVPLFTLNSAHGEAFKELGNGEGIPNWLGLLRNISPAQTLEGKIVFDVPLASYKLQVTDGGEPGDEKEAFISIPLRMDVDTQIRAPSPEQVK